MKNNNRSNWNKSNFAHTAHFFVHVFAVVWASHIMENKNLFQILDLTGSCTLYFLHNFQSFADVN